MLTVEQLKAIAAGTMSVEDAISEDNANEGKKRKFGCCDGPIAKRGPAQGESKLDRALRELCSRRSTMSAEDVAKAEKRIVRLYARWSENNGGKVRKSADGRIGYLAQLDGAVSRLTGETCDDGRFVSSGYRPEKHSVGKRLVRIAKGVELELPGYAEVDNERPQGVEVEFSKVPRNPVSWAAVAYDLENGVEKPVGVRCYTAGATPGAYDQTCKALRIMQGD